MKKLLSGWRHPVRLVAMAMAALSLAWGVALTEGLIAAMVGAALGVIAGELLGRSRLRLGVVVGGVGLLVLTAWKLGALALNTEWLASSVGPGNALASVGVVRFGTLAFGLVTSLRAIAVRRPAALALELGFIAAAVTGVFASHRDGVIARPLWLSDWAWQQGIDPAQVFLAIGAGSVVLLALLLVAETKSGRALSSILALAFLAMLGVSIAGVVGTPQPNPESVLGLTDAGMGGPPRHHNVDGGHPGPSPNEGGDGGNNGQQRSDASDDGNNGNDVGDAGEFPFIDCTTDNDCKGMRYSSDGQERFTCKDVGGCSLANGSSVYLRDVANVGAVHGVAPMPCRWLVRRNPPSPARWDSCAASGRRSPAGSGPS